MSPTRAATPAVGVDLGSRRIGLAVTDRGGRLAFPWGNVERSGDRSADHRAIAAVVAETGAETVVVGLPLSLDGHEGPAARAARAEAAELAGALENDGVAVVTFDERLTTVSAEAALRQARRRPPSRRRAVDAAAATVLLQSWLDGR